MNGFANIEEYFRSIASTEAGKSVVSVLTILKEIKELLAERNIPYKHWPEHLSLRQAMEYSGRTRSCLDLWVREGLLSKPYRIGGSTSVYFSKRELDSVRARWEVRKRKDKVLSD